MITVLQKLAALKIGWLQFNFENSDWNIARLTNYKDIINEKLLLMIVNWLQFNFEYSDCNIFFWNTISIIIFIWVINN